MLAKDRVFWKNVSESLGQKSKFDEELRELLGKRVEEFNSDSDNLENTEKEIRIYCEVIGAIMALKKAAEVAFESDCKKISAQVVMQEKWPEEVWKRLHTYFDCRGIEYEFDEKSKEIILFRNEEFEDYLGDDFDYLDEYGNPVFEENGSMPCTNCVECLGEENCTKR